MDVGSVINMDTFERENFNVENYVKKIVAESIYASNIADTKDKLNRSAQQTAEEIKQSVYKNYANFMETAKEVGHLEGKMNQLRQSLDEQRKLLSLFKNLNMNAININGSSSSSSSKTTINGITSQKSSLAILLEQVEGCSLITQKPGRNLLFHSDLEALHLDDFSVSHKLHAYLLSDSLLLTLPQRKRTRITPTNASSSGNNRLISTTLNNKTVDSTLSASNANVNTYQYKFQAFYELQDIKIINIDDSKEVRNAFQLLKFPESLAFRCSNAHLKKEWLENIENAKKQLQMNELPNSNNHYNNKNTIHEEDEYENDDENLSGKKKMSIFDKDISDFERSKLLRDLFSDFDILLAQRDFEKAVDMLLKIKQSSSVRLKQQTIENGVNNIISNNNNNNNTDAVQQLIYKQKETELINILRKDLTTSKERGNNKGVIKTGKRVVNSLIKLKIYDEAIDLFIDYHKHLNAETLRKIKLEESNTIYMNNVLNMFFENMRISYVSFKEVFSSLINLCFSSYISWCDTEIEVLIKKLQSQHYLGRHFDLTIENCELIFVKAKQFSNLNNFELTFLFETKLSGILESTIKEQHDILMDASIQRSKLEHDNNNANSEQNRQVHVEKFLNDLKQKKLLDNCNEKDLATIRASSSSALQFSYGVINFFIDCLRVYYQDVNFCIVETFTKLFKLELKLYRTYLTKCTSTTKDASSTPTKSNKLKKLDILNNVCCIEKSFLIIKFLYATRTGVDSKFFVKLAEKFSSFKEEHFKD